MPAGPQRQRATRTRLVHARSHIERLLAERITQRRHRHGVRRAPATLGLSSARCMAIARRALGVEHFGQTGSLAELLSPLRHPTPTRIVASRPGKSRRDGRSGLHIKALP